MKPTPSKRPKAAIKLRRDDPEQSKLFVRKAREIGAEDEACGDALIGRLALMPPQPHAKLPKKANRSK
jgi:hypothetical protein